MRNSACTSTPSSDWSRSDGDSRQSRRSVRSRFAGHDSNPILPSRQENAQQSLYFAHLFFVDHMFSTGWTLFFAVVWWAYTPHDGRRVANSAAQEAIRLGAGVNHTMTEAQLAAAANILWHEEKGVAAAVIVLSWFAKVRCIERRLVWWCWSLMLAVRSCVDILCAPAVFVFSASTQRHVQHDSELASTFISACWLRSSIHGRGRRQRRVLHGFLGNTPSQRHLFTFTRLCWRAGKERTSFRKAESKLTRKDYYTRAGKRGGSLRGKRAIIPSYLPPNMSYGPVF